MTGELFHGATREKKDVKGVQLGVDKDIYQWDF